MGDTVNEGDTVYDAQGNEFRIGSDGNPVPASQYQDRAASTTTTAQDLKAGAVPWLAHGTEDLVGAPGGLTDLAARGMQHIPSALGGDYLEKKGKELQGSSFVQNWTPQALAQNYGDPAVRAMGFNPNYQPETTVGRYARTGLEWAPGVAASALFGPETMAATLARGTVGAAASETAGDLAERLSNNNPTASAIARTVGGVAGGHFGPRAISPYPAELAAGGQARVAAADKLAQDLQPYQGSVDAAQRTGRGELRSLLGDAPDNDQAVTAMLLGKANIPYKTGDAPGPLIANAGKQFGADEAVARQNAAVIRDQTFERDLRRTKADATLKYKKGSDDLQEVEDALKQARVRKGQQLPNQPANQVRAGQLSGDNYLNMRDDFLNSDNSHVQQIGLALEGAAHRTQGAPWRNLDERGADYLRLKAAYTDPTKLTLDPNAVANATARKGVPIRTNTPMNESAQRAAQVLAPVTPKPSGLAEAIPPLVGGALSTLIPGTETATKAIGGMMAGGYLSPYVRNMQQALLRNKYAQGYLGNQRLLPGRDYNVPVSGWRALLEKRAQRALPYAGPSAHAMEISDESNK